LRRFTVTPEFEAMQGAISEWTSANFAIVARGAPWLHLVGRRVDDSCQVRVDKRLAVHVAEVGAQCDRFVVAVYGADGPLTERLEALGTLLSEAGWDSDFCSWAMIPPAGPLHTRQSPATSLNWSRASGEQELVPPAGRPQTRSLTVGWISRGESPAPHQGIDGSYHAAGSAEPADPPRKEDRFWWPVEVSPADIGMLTERALAEHEHAIAIKLGATYYFNPDLRSFPMPRKLLPLTTRG
jgi:hypothetical protein